jgi:hypothetical protein
MKDVSHIGLCMVLSSIFPIVISSWLVLEIITITPASALLHAQSCKATTVHHYSGTPIMGRPFGVQAKCSNAISHLTVVNEVNNTGCSTNCMSATNSTVTILYNSEKPIIAKGSSTVTLGSGHYRVIPTRVSGFYEQIPSSNCSGIISSGETKKCIIINSYSNNVQTWVDRLNNVKIQFSYSPPYPFVGNVSQLSFQVTNSSTDKPLQISHIHMTLITNVTASFNNSKTINNKNDFVTFDNLSSNHGIFSLKYQFLAEGAHQIILKINTVDNESLLASFDIPVLFPE